MFVRGISSATIYERIPDECENTVIGVFYSEMRTKDDKLSVWKINDITDLTDAALNIILPKDRVDKACFMIIDEEVLKQYNIEYSEELPDKECVNDCNAEHYNLVNLRVCSISNLLRVYRTMFTKNSEEAHKGSYIITWTPSEAVDKVLEAYQDGKINMSALNSKMQKDIEDHRKKRS